MAAVDLSARLSRWWRDRWDLAPDAGIYIGAGYLATAAVSPAARDYRLLASRVDLLPAGAIVPSPVEPNIRQPGIVVDCLKEAAGMSRRREVALSLPDPAVRVAILEFAQLPARQAERDALFQHQLEQLFLNPLGRCRFAYQRLSSAAGPASGGRQRLLVSAIRSAILEEYESVTRAAGLLPAIVDIAAFHLYNLYEEQICAGLLPQQCALFVNLFDQNFTIILIDQHGPRLIRIKALPGALAEADLVARIMADVDASLRAAASGIGSSGDGDGGGDEEPQTATRLFFFSDRPLPTLDQEIHSAHHVEITRLHLNGRASIEGALPADHPADGAVNGAADADANRAANAADSPAADSPRTPALTTALAAALSAHAAGGAGK